jgi:hypothetical protein
MPTLEAKSSRAVTLSSQRSLLRCKVDEGDACIHYGTVVCCGWVERGMLWLPLVQTRDCSGLLSAACL